MEPSGKIIAFDLDDTLCERDSEEGGVLKYYSCRPVPKMIGIVNELYERGHTIIIYTARGLNQFKGNVHDVYDELYEITKSQLRVWNIKHHRLIMGKFPYDLLVDDKAINSTQVNSVNDILKNL